MSPDLTMHPRMELLAISALQPNLRNARKHSSKQIAQLSANIKRFGFLVPLVIDNENRIAAGHGRWEAAKKLGLEQVPVIRAQFLSDNDRRAFALAENRLAELSEWDSDILSEELKALFDDGIDIDSIGFSLSDLKFSMESGEDAKKPKPEQVELPYPEAQAVSRLGDLWLIGPHRLLCGDSRLVETWESLLGDDRADLVFADAPYNLKINGFVSGNGRHQHREFVMGAAEMSVPEFTAFLRMVFRNCVRFSADGSIHYQCMDWRHMREMFDAADGVYHQFKQLIVWAKGAGALGTFYRSRHELVFVFKAGKAKHKNNFGLGEGGRYRTNVVEYAGANTFRKGRDADLEAHSTVKPSEMVADFIIDCSDPGDLVVDPFVGSGTTLIAAHRTKRRGAGIELDPLYVDTALRRLRKVSGLTPVLAGDDRTFDEIADARRAGEEG